MAIKRLLGLGIVLIAVLAACVPIQEPGLPAQQLSVPLGHYHDVLRFPDGSIFLAYGREPSYETQMALYYVLLEERFIDIDLPDDPRCRRTEYTAATELPNGNLGFSMRCSGYWPDRPLGPDGAQLIMAYDWEKGTIEQIVEEPLPTDTWVPSWNPEMTRGVMSYGGLLGTITWITPTGMEPMTITIGTGEQPWSLAENLVVMEDYRHGNDRTTEVGIARNPAWSPDGRYIAFWASTNVIGRSGMSRARGTYSLYLLDPDTLQLQQILENVQNMTLLVWSPDSQWLSFTGDIGVSKDSLWLTSVDGSILQLIDKGGNVDSYPDFNGWNWLNNQEIIATRCLDANCDQAEVVKYDVSEIVNSAQ